jgi:hypothetical protein
MFTWLFRLIWLYERLSKERDTLYVSQSTLNQYKAGRTDAPYL